MNTALSWPTGEQPPDVVWEELSYESYQRKVCCQETTNLLQNSASWYAIQPDFWWLVLW